MLKGENIYLSKIEKEDMKYIYKWFSDTEFLKYYDYIPPISQSKREVDKIFNDYEKSEESEVFAMKLIKSNEIIGIAGYDDIEKENKVATLFIGIGNKNIRGKGYGKESLNLLLTYGFKVIKLHRIQLNVLEFNINAISLYEKTGFKKEGIFREFVLRDNKRYDLYLYGLLKNEWK
ncbi:GNAT family N-acetyltransferase [Sedimentibacter sp. MB31-C6]|uniref:GNAT family N-acetyltransferase n=1 Tax=Sedimentibacter sp. MB31-C6 TaxID=3109366 RepID=UPI002DDD3A22|nr:GNAT family protein [Sedimentibacter sp. MB36-C1]WSI05445.1 GNAT family protein [Sedimentibacter sp. MB36-C1]